MESRPKVWSREKALEEEERVPGGGGLFRGMGKGDELGETAPGGILLAGGKLVEPPDGQALNVESRPGRGRAADGPVVELHHRVLERQLSRALHRQPEPSYLR